jgi:hypothetical protein
MEIADLQRSIASSDAMRAMVHFEFDSLHGKGEETHINAHS